MKKLSIYLALLVGLAACSGGSHTQSRDLDTIKVVRDALRTQRQARRNPPAPPKVSRAALDKLPNGLLEATVEASGQRAFLVPAANRVDDGAGKVAIWVSQDKANIILRDGVLYATRGLGRDVASSDVGSAVRSIQSRTAVSGTRSMQVRNDNFGADTLRFRCAVELVGDRSITIVGASVAVRHLRERCEADNGFFVNDYYVDSARDVLQSRQWAGPHIGYITLRLLKK